MCNCDDNITLPIGPTGAAGATGSVGGYGGYSGDWIFSTTTTSGTSSSQIRFNSATYSSVTTLWLNLTGGSSVGYTAFLNSLSNGNNFGYIRVFKTTDSTKFWMGRITSLSVGGSEAVLTVTYLTSNSTFSNTDPVVVTFSPSGPTSPTVLYNDISDTTSTATAYASLKSYTVAANTLNTNGDSLGITYISSVNDLSVVGYIKVLLNASLCHSVATEFIIPTNSQFFILEITASRQDNTHLYLNFDVKNSTSNGIVSTLSYRFSEPGLFSVLALDANTLTIDVQGKVAVNTKTITSEQLMVQFFNK